MIGVADQFSRLKTTLWGIIKAIAMLKFFRRMIGRALALLGFPVPAFFVRLMWFRSCFIDLSISQNRIHPRSSMWLTLVATRPSML